MSSGYKVEFTREALKALKKLDKPTAIRVIQAIESLKDNPYEHHQTKKMQGYSGNIFRLRVGAYRVIYEVIENELVIIIVKLGSRGGVYKK